MGKVRVYIAASLDGFIARPDDDISWLDPFSAGDEDYGYGDFIRNTGTAVMGARTYEQSLAHPERLLAGLKNYVLTRRTLPQAPGTRTEFWHGPPAGLIRKIRDESEKDIYVAGGGRVISGFLDEGLIDEILLFVVPVILREGIPLFTGLRHEVPLTLAGVTPYGTGIVKLSYVPGPASLNTGRSPAAAGRADGGVRIPDMAPGSDPFEKNSPGRDLCPPGTRKRIR